MSREDWKNYVSETVKECAAEFGSVKTLAEVKNIDKSTLTKWKNKKVVPRLSTFLKVFPEYNFEGIDQCNFMTKGAPTKNNRPMATPKKIKMDETIAKYCAADAAAVKEVFDSYIASICNACVHQKVCKYSEEFRKFEERFNNEFSITKTGLLIAHAKFECNEFESTYNK